MMHWLLTLFLAAMHAAPDTVVVCPADFLDPLRPWVRHRQQQGHRLTFLSNAQTAEEIRAAIRKIDAVGQVKYVVLVGDSPAYSPLDSKSAWNRNSVPTFFTPARINRRWGGAPEIATDNPYGDFDDDAIPNAAVGRLPADSPEELTLLVEKILRYENSNDFGSWRRRVHFVAGVGGFGRMVDTVLEHAVKRFVAEGIPPAYTATMTYANWRSPFCPDPRRFRETTLERLREGCLFWVYLGHGQRTFLDRVRTPRGAFEILTSADADQAACRSGAPIAVMLACHTAAFDGEEDCLAEELLRSPEGPAAVLGGSRVTMPYAMSVLAHSMLGQYFDENRTTLGEVVLHAKQTMASEDPVVDLPANSAASPPSGSSESSSAGALDRRLLDAIAAAVSPFPKLLAEERKEHLALFNLLGDPMLRLRRPQPLKISAPAASRAGQEMRIQIDSPLNGRCTVELACRRDVMKHKASMRRAFDPSETALEKYQTAYLRANDRVWQRRVFDLQNTAGRTTVTLTTPVPEEARGSCYVRVFVEGEDDFAVGAAPVFVQK